MGHEAPNMGDRESGPPLSPSPKSNSLSASGRAEGLMERHPASPRFTAPGIAPQKNTHLSWVMFKTPKTGFISDLRTSAISRTSLMVLKCDAHGGLTPRFTSVKPQGHESGIG